MQPNSKQTRSNMKKKSRVKISTPTQPSRTSTPAAQNLVCYCHYEAQKEGKEKGKQGRRKGEGRKGQIERV